MIRIVCFVLIVLQFIFLMSCNRPTVVNNVGELSTIKDTTRIVGNGCDGCELMFEGMPSIIASVDTSAGWSEKGKKLVVSGTVLHLDRKTPAADVVLYYWQTDSNGYYSPNGNEKHANRHGHIRGWVKTDKDGTYSIFTIKPAPYPKEDIPAHIHMVVKERDIDNEYYIDDFIFDDDVLLTRDKRRSLENRGGSGILSVSVSGDLLIAARDIILGLNVPNYPNAASAEK